MKKITLLLSLVLCVTFMNAQTVIFNETCGELTKDSPKLSVSEYTGWDNGAPVVFSHTTDRYPDVRATSSINAHIWMPANYDSNVLISNIPASGYTDLKLSFDITSNKATPTEANLNKLNLSCNGTAINLPSIAIEQNVYINSGEIALADAATINLTFLFTAANNPTGYGYRIDNIKIVGTPTSSGVDNSTVNSPSFYFAGNALMTSNVADGTVVEIYNALGAKVQTSMVSGSSVDLDGTISKGLYIIKAGKHTQKIMF